MVNPLEDIYTMEYGENSFRVDVRRLSYNPRERAVQHSVMVYIGGTDHCVARGVTNSAKREYTNSKAIDLIERLK